MHPSSWGSLLFLHPYTDPMTEPTRLETLRGHLKHSTSPYLKKELARQINAEILREDIRACRACPLGNQRTNAVPFTGPTHGKADIVLVGEAPGAVEDQEGEPFVGGSGRLLNRLLIQAGTERKRVTIINALCCRPPENRDPRPHELSACRPLFDRQLSLSKTWVGVALGGYALANILGRPRESIRIADYLNTPIWKDGRVWWGTYHPAYAIRNMDARLDIALSIKAALAVRFGKNTMPPFSLATNEKDRERETKDILDELDIFGKGGREHLTERLHKWGWVYSYSPGLGSMILVVLTELEGPKKPIPPALMNVPRYSLEELIRVGEAGSARGGWSRGDLRRLHMVKVEFGGEVVV